MPRPVGGTSWASTTAVTSLVSSSWRSRIAANGLSTRSGPAPSAASAHANCALASSTVARSSAARPSGVCPSSVAPSSVQESASDWTRSGSANSGSTSGIRVGSNAEASTSTGSGPGASSAGTSSTGTGSAGGSKISGSEPLPAGWGSSSCAATGSSTSCCTTGRSARCAATGSATAQRGLPGVLGEGLRDGLGNRCLEGGPGRSSLGGSRDLPRRDAQVEGRQHAASGRCGAFGGGVSDGRDRDGRCLVGVGTEPGVAATAHHPAEQQHQGEQQCEHRDDGERHVLRLSV